MLSLEGIPANLSPREQSERDSVTMQLLKESAIMSENTILDESLLDMNIGDIEDLPGFEAPYAGEYLLKLDAAVKVVNEKQTVELGYEVMECVKKNSDTDPDTKPGTKFSQLFFLTGEPDAVKVSLGRLKEVLLPLAEKLGEGNLLLLVRDHLKGVQIKATCSRRQDKTDKERYYPTVKNVDLA